MPTPELAPDEVLIATFASSVNYNTVWSAIFEPVPTFAFLKRLAKTHGYGKRHDLPTHVVGSDACGIVLRTGAAVSKWKPGDRVLVHPNYVALEEPQGHDDAILDPDQRVWGFECNFGGMGELCVARGDQLMPKPEHLTWEEAASMPLTNCTAYRMLVVAQRRQHAAGRRRADLGRGRRARRLRAAVRARGRRLPRVRRLERGEGAEVPRGGRGVDHQPRRGGIRASGIPRADSRTRASTCGSARRSAS